MRSHDLCRHLSYFRESFRQLASSVECCSTTTIPFNRQTTIECFEVRETGVAKGVRLPVSFAAACAVLPCEETETGEAEPGCGHYWTEGWGW